MKALFLAYFQIYGCAECRIEHGSLLQMKKWTQLMANSWRGVWWRSWDNNGNPPQMAAPVVGQGVWEERLTKLDGWYLASHNWIGTLFILHLHPSQECKVVLQQIHQMKVFMYNSEWVCPILMKPSLGSRLKNCELKNTGSDHNSKQTSQQSFAFFLEK